MTTKGGDGALSQAMYFINDVSLGCLRTHTGTWDIKYKYSEDILSKNYSCQSPSLLLLQMIAAVSKPMRRLSWRRDASILFWRKQNVEGSARMRREK
jgi:hypothetical protein